MLSLFSNQASGQSDNDSMRDLVLLSFHIKGSQDWLKFIEDNKLTLAKKDPKGNNILHIAAIFGAHEFFVRLTEHEDWDHLVQEKNLDDKCPASYWADVFKKALCGLPNNKVLSIYMETFIVHSSDYFDFHDSTCSAYFFKCLLSSSGIAAVDKARVYNLLDYCDFAEYTISEEVSSYLGSLGFGL